MRPRRCWIQVASICCCGRVPRKAVAGGLALACSVAAFSATAIASPNIKTLAGGGTRTPVYYDAPSSDGVVQGPDADVPAPAGLAWAGDPSGIFYVIPT